jgi:DNA-binding GntR family transcriptional regulator
LADIINQKSITEIVYNKIREDILSQKYLFGDRLDVNILSRQYGISRSPIVSAISRLAHEGLVEIKPRRGSFVVEPTERDIEEVTQTRIALEIYALEKAIPLLDKEHILRIDQALMAAEKEDFVKNSASFFYSDRILHETIFELANNSRLFAMIGIIRSQIELFRIGTSSEEGGRQAMVKHRLIFKAMCEKNFEKSKLLLRQHIEEVGEEALKMLKKHYGREKQEALLPN